MGLFRRRSSPEDELHRWPPSSRLPTTFMGIEPGSGAFPYEFTTATGVRVALHEMQFVGLDYRVRPPTLTVRFRYDDPGWTPPEAVTVPVAVFEFTGVQVWQWEDEHDFFAVPDEFRGQVRAFDWYEPTNTFSLHTVNTRLLFSADRVAVSTEAASAD